MPITATRSTTFRPLTGDQDGDGYADAGDVLRHTLTLTNTGTAATGVTVNDLLGGSTETGLVNISPIAFGETFTAVGNTVLRVGGAANNGTGPSSQVAGNLMSNDVGSGTKGPGVIAADDVPDFIIDTQNNALTRDGGRVNIFSDGSFNYVSAAGDTGDDTFTYTIRDAGFDGLDNTADDLTSTATVTITISGQVWYVDSAAAPGTGTGTSNDPFGTLTSVQAVDSSGDYVYVKGNAVPGTLVMEANELLIGTGEALTVSGFNLATAGSNSTINNSGSGLTLSTDNTIKGVTINNTATGAVGIQDGGGTVGTLTIDTVSISGTGKAIDIDAGGTLAVDIDSLSSTSSSTQGVHLQGVTGSFNATTGHIQTAGEQGFLIGAANGVTASSGGNATITYGGAITNATGSSVEIQDRTGGTVTFSGQITEGAIANGGRGIWLDGNAGTVNFTGQVFLTAGATSGQGVQIGANAATVNFNATGTGLDISTTSGAGFSASGGGTVNVTGSANTIASTTGTALNVNGTTIGSSGLNFFSIGANGAVNGIVLTNTGTSGGLTVTGDGGVVNNGTGGTILNTTGDAISLTNTMNVVLGRMNITGADGMGINGNGVYGIVLTRLNISGSGDSAAADEGGIRILELTGDASHVTQFNNISVTNSFEHNVFIRNTGGTLSNLVVANSTFTNNGASTQAGMHFIFEANTGGLGGTPTMTAHFTGNTFTGSTTVGQLTSHALQAAANDGLLTIFIGDGTVGGRNTFTTNAVGIDLDTSGAGNLNFNVNNNTLTDTTSNAINIFRGASSTGTVNGFVTNNVIGTQGVATSGSEVGSGVRVGSEGGGITRVLIDSNIIQSIGVNGVSGGPNIDLTQGIASPPGGYVDGTMHATVINNTLRDNADSRAMNSTARNGTINLDFHGNTLSGITGTSGTFIRLSADSLVASDDGVFNLPQASLAAVAAANTGLTTGQISSNGTINFNQAPPQAPTAFLFVEAPGPLVEDEPEASDGTPPADPAAPGLGQPIVVDDGVVSQAELDLIVEAAIQRWAEAGATAEQLEAMRSTIVVVANLQGLQLGTSAAGEIVIDHNAAGFNWFIDSTPDDDSEYAGDGTRLAATPNTVAALRVDLLTTVMHELGHQIGLEDNYASGDSDELMFGSIMAGERRLPGADDVASADGTHVTGTAFALTQISLGDIPVGQVVVIQWESTVLGYNSVIVPTFTNFSTITGNNPGAFSTNSTNDTMGPGAGNNIVMDSLTLGGTLWNDDGAGGGIAGNGIKDGTEAGHAGVTLTLFADTGGTAGVWDATDAQLVTGLLTDASGNYAFTGLAPGDYIVRVDSDNFDANNNISLVGRATSAGGPDPDDNIDNDDNGSESGGAVYSQTITLAHGAEPDGTPGGPGDTDGDADPDTNFTLDFGFVYLNQAPVNTVPAAAQVFDEDGSVTFSTANGNAISVVDVDAASGQIVVTLSIADGVLTPMAGSGATIGGTPNALTITGTLTQVNAALNGLVYTPPADANGPRTLTVLTNDQGNTGFDPGLTGNATSEEDSDPVSITINAVNDTPAVTVASPIAVDEQVAEAIAPTGTVSDLELDLRNGGNGDYDDATLTVVRNGGAAAQDLLAVVNGAGFVVNGTNLEAGSLVFATISGGSGSALVITFTSSGTPATSTLVDAVLQAIQYTFTGDSPPASIQLDVTLNDGAPANGQGDVTSNPASATSSITVNIANTPENQPPVVDLDTGTAGNDDTNLYVENGSGSGIGVAIGVTDAESDMIQSATITITDPETGDLLSASLPLPGGITIHGSSTATTLVLTGSATAADYASALGQVGYSSSSEDPTDGGTNTNRVITVTVNDGTSDSAPATMTMTVAAVNDVPTLAATGLNPAYNENGAAADLFSGVTVTTPEGGQSLTSLTLTVSNVTDGANEILSFDGSDVALTNGTAVTTATNGLNVTVAVSGSTATLSFSGASLTPGQVQTLVDAMTYRNASENPTDADRAITVTALVDSGPDSGDNENAAALSVLSTVNVNPANDAANITGDAAGSVTEAGGLNNVTPGTPTDSGNLDSTDVDNPADSWAVVAAGAATIGGYGTYAVTAAGVWTYTLDDNNAAVQALTGAATLSDTFNATTVDGTAQLVTVTINAQEDAASANDDSFATNEATAIPSGNVFLGAGADVDPDGPAFAVTAVSGGTVGTQFALASGALLTLNANGTFNYNPNGVFNQTPTPGSGASNQPALDSFMYTITGGDTATVTITITGLDTNDLLLGTAGADTLSGGAGNDLYRVEQAGDVVSESVGGGFDSVYVALALSSYTLATGSEIELVSAIDPSSTITMNLTGNAFDNTLIGTAGSNTLIGGRGVDVMAGLGGNDFYRVEQVGDIVLESVGGGFDSVYVALGLGSYTLQEGYEIELVSAIDPASTVAFDLTGNGFGNTIIGTAGTNTLIGGGGNDVLAGGAGDDFYRVEQAADVVLEYGGGGFDSVYVSLGLGSYTLQEGYEIELLSAIDPAAMAGMNLTGNEFANTIIGTGGANVLDGGRGADVLLGSGGADTFAFTTALGGGNVDTILDFTAGSIDGDDMIQLDDAVFAGLAPGALDPGAFTIGSAAQDGDDRIIFDASTGALYFDADGNGAGAAVQFATLSGVTALTSADFIVI